MSEETVPDQVELSGRLVRLREFTADDLPEVAAIVGDDRVTTFLSFDSRTDDQARAMLDGVLERATHRPRAEYYLAVTPVSEDRVVGFARLGLGGVRAAKLGYAVAYEEQGNGYATDAARTLVNFAFGALSLHRITAAVGPDNAASLALLERLGFTREGRLRDHVYTNGAWRDSLLYSILVHECPRSIGAGTANEGVQTRK